MTVFGYGGAQIFIGLDFAQMKVVADAGLVGGTQKTFAKNRLVLIYPKGAKMTFASPADAQ